MAVHTSVAKDAIIKATGRVNSPLEYWGCTTSPRDHADRFHTYRNYTNKMYQDMAERENMSIQYKAQRNPAMGGSRGYEGIQYLRGQKSSTTMCSMFEYCRDCLSQ